VFNKRLKKEYHKMRIEGWQCDNCGHIYTGEMPDKRGWMQFKTRTDLVDVCSVECFHSVVEQHLKQIADEGDRFEISMPRGFAKNLLEKLNEK
jgi:rubredoxin